MGGQIRTRDPALGGGVIAPVPSAEPGHGPVPLLDQHVQAHGIEELLGEPARVVAALDLGGCDEIHLPERLLERLVDLRPDEM